MDEKTRTPANFVQRTLPNISGDAEADEKRRQLDLLIKSRTHETKKQKREYEEFYENLNFTTSEDRETFDLLPLSNFEKMKMIQEMVRDGELEYKNIALT